MRNFIYLNFNKLIFENIINNLTLYYGSKNDFDEFNLSGFGLSDNGQLGYGTYLTNDYEYPETYSEVYECKVDIQNPLVLTDFRYETSPDRLKEEFNADNVHHLTSILKKKVMILLF